MLRAGILFFREEKESTHEVRRQNYNFISANTETVKYRSDPAASAPLCPFTSRETQTPEPVLAAHHHSTVTPPLTLHGSSITHFSTLKSNSSILPIFNRQRFLLSVVTLRQFKNQSASFTEKRGGSFPEKPGKWSFHKLYIKVAAKDFSMDAAIAFFLGGKLFTSLRTGFGETLVKPRSSDAH